MPRKLPEGWPDDHTGLSHEDLDELGIPSTAAKKDLSLDGRREIYRKHYLPSDEETMSGKRRRMTVAVGVLLIGIAAAVFFASTLRDTKAGREYAVGLCDRAVRAEIESSVSITGTRDVVTDDDDVVTEVSGALGSEDENQPTAFTCHLELTDGEYRVRSVDLAP